MKPNRVLFNLHTTYGLRVHKNVSKFRERSKWFRSSWGPPPVHLLHRAGDSKISCFMWQYHQKVHKLIHEINETTQCIYSMNVHSVKSVYTDSNFSFKQEFNLVVTDEDG